MRNLDLTVERLIAPHPLDQRVDLDERDIVRGRLAQ